MSPNLSPTVLFIRLRPILILVAILGGVLIFPGCHRHPEGILSDSEMEELMVDLILAEAYGQNSASSELPDSVRSKLGEGVLIRHGIDQQTLDSTYSWYARNLDDYYKLYARVDKRLKKMREKSGGAATDDSFAGDIWQLPRHILFTPLAKSDAIVFELPGEAIGKGDAIEWKFRMSQQAEIHLQLGIDYTDSTSSLTDKKISNDRSITLKFQSDTARVAKRIFGVASVKRDAMPLWIDSLRIIKSSYDSLEYSRHGYQKFSAGPRRRVIRKDTAQANKIVDPANNLTKPVKNGGR